MTDHETVQIFHAFTKLVQSQTINNSMNEWLRSSNTFDPVYVT